jgi:hypothetical protein
VSFKTGEPSKFYGYIANGAYFGAVNTALDTGAVAALPEAFTWSRLTPEELFAKGTTSATWEGGIACANVHGAVTTTWNAEFVFTASTTDPHGFTWRVHQSATVPGRTTLSVGVILIILAVVFGLVAVVLSWRSRSGRGAGGPPTPSVSGDAPPGPTSPGAEGPATEPDPLAAGPTRTTSSASR